MKLKRGSARQRIGKEQPFRSFEVEISTLERAARQSEDPAARSKAADLLIAKARALKGQGMLALPDTQRRFDIARFALEQVVKAQDPDIRKQAFDAMAWNPITLKSFTKAPFPADIRQMARERLDSAGTRRSELIKEDGERRPAGSRNYILGTWRTA